MKHFIRIILTGMAFIVSWIYPYKILQYAKILFFDKIYSFVIKSQLKKSGINLSIEPPIILDGAKYISVGDNVSIRSRCWIGAYNIYYGYRYSPSVEIGNHVIINFNSHIACINSIIIGDNSLISSNVLISDHSHGNTSSSDTMRRTEPLISKGPIIIGKNVWIGEKASILSGVSIGDNSIIGANSVVTQNIPPNCVAVGNPARIIRVIP